MLLYGFPRKIIMLGIIFAVLPRMIDAGHINPTALADKPFIDLAFPDLPGLSTIDLGQEVFNQEKGIIHHLAFSNIALDLIRIEDLLLPIQDLQEVPGTGLHLWRLIHHVDFFLFYLSLVADTFHY